MLVKVVTTFPFWPNIPSERATNSLYFDADWLTTPTEGQATALRDIVQAFYQGAYNGSFLSPVVNRSAITVTYYDMSQPEPRAPIYTGGLTLTAGTQGTQGMAEEVAVALSFQGAKLSGESQARRRGRIYLGPFNATIVAAGTGTSFAQVNTTFRGQLANAAANMLLSTGGSQTRWVVYSPTNGTFTEVTDGWVDYNLDSQRRRGGRTPGRQTWT